MPYASPDTDAAALDVRTLSRGVALLTWTSEDGTTARRCQVGIAGQAAHPPVAHTSIPLGAGRVRNLMALRVGDLEQRSAVIEVHDASGRILARRGEPGPAQMRSNDLDPVGLIAGFDAAGRVRLARFVTEVCNNVFQLGADREFITNCRQILGEISGRSGAVAPLCVALDRYVLCETTVRGGLGTRLSAVVVGPGLVRRLPFLPASVAREARPERTVIALLIDAATLLQGATVVIFGENGLACRRIVTAARPSQTAIDWALTARGKSATRGYLLDCLARLAGDDPQAAALLHELQVLVPRQAPAAPERSPIAATTDLVVGTEAGVFIAGWIKDPHGLADAVEIERSGRTLTLPVSSLLRFPPRESEARGAEPIGFAAFATETVRTNPHAPCRIRIRMRSGELCEISDGPAALTAIDARDAILAAIPTERADATSASCLEPVLAALQEKIATGAATPDIIDIGPRRERPTACIIAPIGADVDIVRCRIGMIATDRSLSGVELVHVLDRGRDRAAAERLLRALQDIHGISSRLVIVPDRSDPGATLNAAARSAESDLLVFLGPALVPESAGWLSRIDAFLRGHPRCGVVAPRSVFEDHSIAAAGFGFGLDSNGAWGKQAIYGGFPRDFAPAASNARVPAATGCLAISRSLYELAGGFAEDLLLPSYRDADLCLRVSAQGLETWRLGEPALLHLGVDDDTAIPSAAIRAAIAGSRLERRWRAHIEQERIDAALPDALPDGEASVAPARGERKHSKAA